MRSGKFENEQKIPRHVAIIMDGNGRWARRRGMPRSVGHKQGAAAARRAVEYAANYGIEYITLFAFSSENWNRPKSEINELMKLLRYYLRSETVELHKKNVRLRVIGDYTSFDDDIVRLINNAEDLTRENDGINVVIALNYGGKQDIAQAVKTIIKESIESGVVPTREDITNMISERLMSADIPDPDLIIRTSGEKRLSNFLLWQSSYSEFFFSPVLWPDFSESSFEEALNDYARRERRFGAIKST